MHCTASVSARNWVLLSTSGLFLSISYATPPPAEWAIMAIERAGLLLKIASQQLRPWRLPPMPLTNCLIPDFGSVQELVLGFSTATAQPRALACWISGKQVPSIRLLFMHSALAH